MIITQENATLVSKLFRSLLDERFTMRTLAGIRKGGEIDVASVSDQTLVTAVAEMGMVIKRRMRDDAMLIERPVPVLDLQALVTKVDAVAAGTEQPFEIDFAPVELPEALPVTDVMADVEGGLGRTHGNGDEDESFS